MVWGKVLFLLSALTVVGVGCLLRVPAKQDVFQRWKLQFGHQSIRFLQLASAALSRYGSQPLYFTVTKLWEAREVVMTWLTTEPDGIQTKAAVFDGVPVLIHSPRGHRPGDRIRVRLHGGGETKYKDLSSLAGFVFFHGGGWTTLSPEAYSGITRRIARSLRAVVVSVDYRLAPKHVFPAAFEDSVIATKHLIQNAAKYGVNPERIGVGGDGTGANLAAAVAIKLRDDGVHPPIKLQVLISPFLQCLDLATPSYQQIQTGWFLNAELAALSCAQYAQGSVKNVSSILAGDHVSTNTKGRLGSSHMNVANLPKEAVSTSHVHQNNNNKFYKSSLWLAMKDVLLNPYFSPLIAENLANLPHAYILTGGQDPSRDDGLWYYKRLQKARNWVKHKHCDTCFQGIFWFHNLSKEVDDILKEALEYVKEHLISR